MKIELVDPNTLRIHPALQTVPDGDPDLIISMTCDIEDRGIDQPLIVDEKNRVMDGRVRLKIALAEEMSEVPVRRASSADVATIIVQSLLQRRHYSRSALAYIAFPFFTDALEEAKARRVAWLSAPGGKKSNSTQNVLLPGSTAEGIARQAGVSRALFFQARDVHKLFAKHPHTREQFEPKILSGELCLGYAINGISGQVSTSGRSRGAEDQLELFGRTVATLKIRFAKWDQIPANKRTFIANEFAETLVDAPAEIQDRVFKALAAQRKAAR